MSRRRVPASVVALSSVVLGVTLPLLALLAAGKTFVWRDTAKLAAPTRSLIVESLRNFELPLWNPHEAFGIPLLAQQMYGALHPVSLVMAFIAPDAGMDTFIVLYVALAAAGATVAARQLGATWTAAAVAGFAYGASGYLLSMSSVLHYLGGASTAPWAVAGLLSIAQRHRHGVLLGALGVAACALAGEPQWLIVAVLLGGALVLARRGLAAGTPLAASIALGAALGSLQLLPGWAYFGETQRAVGLTIQERSVWTLPPMRLLELLAPGLFVGPPGAPAPAVYGASAPDLLYGIPFVSSVFLGLVAAAAAVVALRRNAVELTLATAAALALWLSLGPVAGADAVARHLPVWGAFRYPEKLIGPFTLCASWLAALGADRLKDEGSQRRFSLAAATLWVAASVVGLTVLAFPSVIVATTITDALAAAVRARFRTGLLLLLVAAALAAVVARLIRRESWARDHGVAVVAGAVFLESILALPFALYLGDPSKADSVAFLRQHATLPRIGVPFPQIPTHHPESPDEFARLSRIEASLGVTAYNVRDRVDSVSAYTGQLPAQYMAVIEGIGREFGARQFWPAMRRFGLTHVAVGPLPDSAPSTQEAAQFAVAGGRAVLRTAERSIWEVPHRPWAFFATETVPANSGEDAVKKLMSVLEAGSEAVVVETSGPLGASPGTVLRAIRRPAQVTLEGESSGNSLLVVNDSYWPGWRASIDGQPIEIFRADGMMRAVSWPKGRHVLELRYAPGEVLGAKWLTTAAAAVCLVLALRRRGSSAPDGPAGDRGSTTLGEAKKRDVPPLPSTTPTPRR